ncbi:MAG TPA: serine/threonine-protein kinase [Polyangiaceae bacterium]|jgi:serine/threonine-protein kinase
MDDVPRQIGRYEIVGHLASGGMAEVFLARLLGPSGFERPVVVKRILPHLARTKEFVDMFVDEARIVAGIHHPNVVAVSELGREGGDLFLVLEYLEGESASGLMRRLTSRAELLEPRLAAHIVAEACAGLHAAHELADADGVKQNLVHRDMTPHNLFITYDGAVKVLDFGIAKVADRMSRTEAGQVKGKFEYMSPEQCLGKPLDRRSDIFALGIVLYEMSTGHRLFKRPTQLMTLKSITEEAIKPPSALRAGYPKELETICMTALNRSPEERYATAAEMRRALLAAMRALEPPNAPMPEEELAARMNASFADRIETKTELLRRVRAGSKVTELPAAETDGSIEIPVAVDDPATMTEAGASIVASTRPRERARWPIALGAIVLAAGTAAVVLATHHRAAPAAATAPPATATASATATAAPTATAPASVTITIESIPPGATVFSSDQELGPTPYTLTLAKSDAPVDVEVRKDGFVTQRESLVPNVEQRIRLTLPRAAPVMHVAPASHPKPQPSATPGGGFHRFD